MKRSSSQKPVRTIPDTYRMVATACLVGIAITAALLLLMAFIISSVDFPQSGIAPASLIALILGCFSAGFLCSRMLKSGGLLYGLICGSAIFVLGLICELSFLGGELGTMAVFKFVICITSAMIGGVLGVNKRKKLR